MSRRTKLSKEEKIEIYKSHLDRNLSAVSLTQSYDDERTIYKWIIKYSA